MKTISELEAELARSRSAPDASTYGGRSRTEALEAELRGRLKEVTEPIVSKAHDHLTDFRSRVAALKGERVVIVLVNDRDLMGTIYVVGTDYLAISDSGIDNLDYVKLQHVTRIRKV